MSLFDIITYLGNFILIFNVIIYFKSFTNLGKAFKIFLFYIFFLLVIESISYYYFQRKLNNIFISHYYIGVQFIMLNFFFFFLSKSELIRNSIKVLFPLVFFTILCQYIFYVSDMDKFNVFGIVLTQLVVIFYCILFFFRSLNLTLEIGNNIIFGLLIYMLGSTIFFSSGNFLSKNMPSLHKALWIGNSALYLIFQILISIEWWKNFSQKKMK